MAETKKTDTSSNDSSENTLSEVLINQDEHSQKIENLQRKIDQLNDIITRLNLNDRFLLIKPLALQNTDIKIYGTTGTKIGGSKDKLSVYGVAPITQQAAIAAPSGGTTIDTQARATEVLIIAALKNFGITL